VVVKLTISFFAAAKTVTLPLLLRGASVTSTALRGWGGRDSRVMMLLQQERASVEIAVDRERLREALAPAEGRS
jgi:hypothetical protein